MREPGATIHSPKMGHGGLGQRVQEGREEEKEEGTEEREEKRMGALRGPSGHALLSQLFP